MALKILIRLMSYYFISQHYDFKPNIGNIIYILFQTAIVRNNWNGAYFLCSDLDRYVGGSF